MSSLVLVTGAAGKTGRAVTQALAARGVAVRAFVRRPEQEALMAGEGAADIHIGDIEAPADLARACAGVGVVYHICPNMHPDEVAIGRLMLAAAQAAGVARFVYHSVLHPQTEEMPHHWHKLRVEELLLRTGLAFTILQPAAYYQNVLAYLPEMAREGVYRVPYAPATRLGMVDLADVAEAAARVVVEEGHERATYQLAGGEVLSAAAVAAACGAWLGRPVQVETIAREAWAAAATQAGMAPYAVATLCNMFDYYERYGFAGNPAVLRMLLGHAPRTSAKVLERRGEGRGARGDMSSGLQKS